MSRSKFKVTKGLAQIIISGEPVYVQSIENDVATVTRPIVTQNGIQYVTEQLPLEQLETRFEDAKRKVELEAYIITLRKEAEQKMFELPKQMKLAIDQHKANAAK